MTWSSSSEPGPAPARPHRAAVPLVVALLVSAGFVLAASGLDAQEAPEGAAVDSSLYQELDYRMVGPSRGGRVTAVAGHPDRPATFVMGATGGGVWKTTDYGASWHNVSDGFFSTGSIGAVQVAPSDPDVVYVGTGSHKIRSNVITGKGVYRSTDGGESWTFLGLEDAGQIGALEIHPEDPDRVYVAALGHPFGKNEQRGVFRSTDGGESWEKVHFLSDSVGAADVELHPTDPSVVYSTMWRGERKPWTIISGCAAPCGDGIWRSDDGGDSWAKVLGGEDMPEELIGRAEVAVTADDPDRVYALVEALEPAEGLYRSDDRGETWRLVNDRGALMTRPFYFTTLAADPTDADVVYVGNVRYYGSTDGGETFERRSATHADVHDQWINPEDSRIMIQGNDGGATVTRNRGESWSTQHNQPTAELYQVDVDERFPYWLYAGQQDNSTIAVPSRPPAESDPAGPESHWDAIGGCETGPVVPKPGDATIVYANCKGRFGRYSRATGQEKQFYVGAQYMYGRNPAELDYRFQRVSPIEVSPHDPDVVYHGSQFVHRTTDDGQTWETISPDLTAFPPERQMASGGPITRDITGEEHFSTLYEIEVSPLDAGVVWTGANDGPVHVTRDGGETWTEVTPEGMPPEGRIETVEPSSHDPGRAYVAGYRYLLDDWEPYIYRTTDFGETWTRLTDGQNGIPADHPTRVVREDPEQEGLLYAGTEFGMFVSFDDGARWQPLQLDLPVTPITDIRIHRGDMAISTMGRSFWILHDLTPLRAAAASVESGGTAGASSHRLLPPRDATRMRYFSFGSDPAEPDYPPAGAVIDYVLSEDVSGPVTLEILDDEGALVRAYSSEEDGYEVEDPSRMAAPGPYPVTLTGPTLETGAGHHRVRWDLTHAGAWDEDGQAGRGPMAVPGTYTVRLQVDGRTLERELEVDIDPRVAADGVTRADLQAQLDLNLRIRDARSEARRAVADLEAALERVDTARADGSLSGDEATALEAELRGVLDRLVTSDEGSYPPPMFLDQLGYLSGMTGRADQRPGRDAYERFDELRSRLDDILAETEEAVSRAPGAGGA